MSKTKVATPTPGEEGAKKEVSTKDEMLIFVGQSVITFTTLLLSNSKKKGTPKGVEAWITTPTPI